MQNSGQKTKRHKISRMEVLRRAETSKCIGGHEGDLWNLENDNLNKNNVNRVYFSGAIIAALAGITSCGKTLIVKDACQIFETLSNPSTKSLALVGMEETVIVFLNDCCWCEKFTAWQDLLKLLEGDALHIAAPKIHFLKDLIMYKKHDSIYNINLTNTVLYKRKN